MPLEVIERQTTETWYALTGDLAARDVFPRLLPNSESIKEVEEDITTESEFDDGKYDGYPQDDGEMEEEIDEFTQSAISEFHDEALTAAKTTLTALNAGKTLLHKDYEHEEEDILEEAAKALGIAVPWDPAEAAQIAAEEAAGEARLKREREQQELRTKEAAEVLEKARHLFTAGNSHAVVRAMFPNFTTEIANLVGALRREGVTIAAR